MWNRNYYNLLTAAMLADDTLTSSTQPTDYTPPIRNRTTAGAWAEVRPSNQNFGSAAIMAFMQPGKYGLVKMASEIQSFSGNDRRLGLMLGSGSNPESYEDYKLQSVISPSNWTLVSETGTLTQPTAFNSATHKMSSKRSYTCNNSSNTNLTISEAGLYCYDGSKIFLINRILLDTPVTLAPSESMIIRFDRDAEVYNYTPYPA